MPKNTYKIAHAIVGYNQLEYIRNAIDSGLKYRIDDEMIFVFVTGGGSNLFNQLVIEYAKTRSIVFKYVERKLENIANSKTGLLYYAYNDLMNLCDKMGVDFLNLFQSDLQLLHWNSEIINHYLDIFENFDNAVMISNGFIRKGSHPNLFRSERLKMKYINSDCEIHYIINSGVIDWGFISLKRWKNFKLSWKGSETNMGMLASEKTLVLPLSRFPCVAPIPWPAVVRLEKTYGNEIKRLKPLLLILKDDKAFHKLKLIKAGPIWYEDWVTTWGWWSLEPTWATSFSLEYLEIQLKEYGSYKSIPFKWSKYGKTSITGFLLFSRRRPDLRYIVSAFSYNHFFLPKIYKKIRSILKFQKE